MATDSVEDVQKTESTGERTRVHAARGFLHAMVPRNRLQRLRSSSSYGFVLALLIVCFLLIALGPDETWTLSVVVVVSALTLAAALWTTGLRKDTPSLAMIAVVCGVVVAAQIPAGESTGQAEAASASAAFLLAAAVAIGIGVVDQREVNVQSVVGAITIYLTIGMVFTFLYSAGASWGDEDFFAQGTDGTPSIRLYFSFVTLATLGYGDYTPATDLGRTLAVTEALIGQLYLVTVLAILVANLGRARRGSE
jgi:hypothetical protein